MDLDRGERRYAFYSSTPGIQGVLILHLQRLLTLNPREISEILRAEKPPYSLQDVDRILAKRQGADPNAEAESFHEAAD